jgi:hypothetical protein
VRGSARGSCGLLTFFMRCSAFISAVVFLAIAGCDSIEVTEQHFKTYDEAAKSGLVGEGRINGWVPRSAVDIHVRVDAESNARWLSFRAAREHIASRMRSCVALSPGEVKYPHYRPRGGWWPESLSPDGTKRSTAFKYYRCEKMSVTAVDDDRGEVFEWHFSS